MKGFLVLANLHKFKGENTLSLEIAEEARVFASREKEHLWEARLLGFTSSLYHTSGMIDFGEEHLQKALKVAKKAPDSEELNRFYANTYYEMAYYASFNKEYERALSYIDLSNLWARKQNKVKANFHLALNYHYKGILFNRLYKSDSAIISFENSLELLDIPTDLNTKTLKNFVYTNMGYSYMLQNDFETARELLTKVLNDSEQFKALDLNQELYKNWAYYYQKNKQLDSMKIYSDKLDSINNIVSKSTTDVVNNVTKKLQDENKLLLQKSNKWTYGIVFGVVFIFAVLCFLIFNRRSSKVNQNQKEKKEVKEEASVVKEVKIEELHIAKDTEERLINLIKSFEKNKEYLHTDVSQTLLANQFNTNTKYITYVLRKLYDRDFNTYINELKVNHIIQLLETDKKYRQYKISYLAEVAGYSSHSKFAAVFKKIKGCSPSEFIAALENKPKTNPDNV